MILLLIKVTLCISVTQGPKEPVTVLRLWPYRLMCKQHPGRGTIFCSAKREMRMSLPVR